MTSRWLAVFLLAGCGAASGSATRSSSLECDPVISNMFARSVGFVREVLRDQPPEMSKQLASTMDRIEPVLVQACREDRWSVELLGCLDGMTVTDDPHKCNHLFTEDQAVKLSRRMIAVVMRPPPG